MEKIEDYTVLSLEQLVTIQGGKKKYTGPNYSCIVKSGGGLAGGAVAGIPGGVAGVIGGGIAGLVGGAVSCLH